MNKSNDKKIEKLKNLIIANKSVIESNPSLTLSLNKQISDLEDQIDELEKHPIINKIVHRDSNQEDIDPKKCKAIVGSTNKPCCNSEAVNGYCLIHLKQRDPQMAEDFQRNRLAKKFGLTEEEIDKIKDVNGTLENMSKGLAVFIKSQRAEL